MSSRLYFSSQASLALALAADSGVHAHRAVQLCIALDPGVRLTTDAGERALDHAELLAPQQSHRLRGQGQRLLLLFNDPGPRAWQRWLQTGGTVREPDARLRDELRHAFDDSLSQQGGIALAERLRNACLPGLTDAQPEDSRVARALAMIQADPTVAEHSYRALAGRLHLSPSRFAALFSEHAGMPVRNYVLWCRLQFAIGRLQLGDNITTSAHAAGFADAAHFSRSFRRVLGAAPSEVRIPGDE